MNFKHFYMKHKMILLSFLFLHALASAQNFEEALKDAYTKFEKSDTLQNKINASNRLDLIAARYTEEWTSHYYSAYAKVIISYLLKDEKQRDGLIDQAEEALTKAKGLVKDNEELLIMEAYIANARLAVKPMSRHKKYGEIFDKKLEEATALNPTNPRIYFLKGQSIFHTPKAFGGGGKNALPFFEKAATLFEKEPKDDLHKPYWGSTQNSYYISECRRR
jgi:hypothetical protein